MQGLNIHIREMREQITTIAQAEELNKSVRDAVHVRIPHKCKMCGAHRFLFITVNERLLQRMFSGAVRWEKKPCACADAVFVGCGQPQHYICCVDKNNQKIFEGDRVLVPVMRLSGSHSSWCQVRNEEHGSFWLEGIIEHELDECAFKIHVYREKIKALEQPRGREKFTQHVSVQCNLDANIYELFTDTFELQEPQLINRELNKTHKNIEVIGHIYDGRTDNT